MKARVMIFQHDSEQCQGQVVPCLVILTEDCKIIFQGTCLGCGAIIQFTKTMEEIICEFPGDGIRRADAKPSWTVDDGKFLRALKILPPNQEAA